MHWWTIHYSFSLANLVECISTSCRMCFQPSFVLSTALSAWHYNTAWRKWGLQKNGSDIGGKCPRWGVEKPNSSRSTLSKDILIGSELSSTKGVISSFRKCHWKGRDAIWLSPVLKEISPEDDVKRFRISVYLILWWVNFWKPFCAKNKGCMIHTQTVPAKYLKEVWSIEERAEEWCCIWPSFT